MKLMFRSFIICLLVFSLLPLSAQAAEGTAADLSGLQTVAASTGFSSLAFLFDGDSITGTVSGEGASLTLEHPEGIGSLYLIFDDLYGAYTLTDNATGKTCTAGTNAFYHEFLDLCSLFGSAPTSVTVDFDRGPVKLCELSVYGPGEVPDTVQKWDVPYENGADLVLFSTHGDDDQLFFAGVLPYYAAEMGYRVQVVYFTDHRLDDSFRVHEMLDGLWAVGVRAYPVFGDHPDFMRRHDLEGTYAEYAARGYSQEQLLEFVVENIRRFKPLVAVGHDIKGEYGHGMHMVYTDLLIQALDIAPDEAQFPESAAQYGTWEVPKTYLHLYEENPIVMDWDRPLESFDGMTAFEVTKNLGYPCHKSQYQDFAWYLVPYDTAAECPKYNPCNYGLYRSTVGADVQKNDFFENLTVYAEQERIALEQQLAQETARQESLAAAETKAPTGEPTAPESQPVSETPAPTSDSPQDPSSLKSWLYLEIGLSSLLILLLCIRIAVKRRR